MKTPSARFALNDKTIILNFHGVGPLPQHPIDPGESECWLDESHFTAILDLVSDDPRVGITFDDGNASDHTIVLPALTTRHLTAAFFICAGRIGKPGFLDQAQIAEITGAGMEIGNHGTNHRSWRMLPAAELICELQEGRKALGLLTGNSINTAACPFGAYDRRVLKALSEAGYETVYTSDGGPCRDRWLVARNTIKRTTTMHEIDRMIRGSADPSWKLRTSLRMMVKSLRPGRRA
jgi:peptidoglycan/xylan/chitin deacetylase (PgdA/CDA1 family)